MRTKIKAIIEQWILDLRVKHHALGNHQQILIEDKHESIRYAKLELRKAWIELNIAVLRALIGESK